MRSSWLYFATRSVREALPVLICPTPVATARSAMNVSSVSPERCEITAPYPFERACPMRSEEHTSELQSRLHLVCRLLLEKKNTSELQSPCKVVCALVLGITKNSDR